MTQVTPMQADKEAAEECAVELLRHAHYDAKIPGSVNTDIIARHIARARAEEREGCTKPDMFWRAVDPEYSVSDPEEFLEHGDYDDGAVLHLQTARKLPEAFVTVVGEPGRTQTYRTATEPEIEAYIAKCRIERDKRIATRALEAIRALDLSPIIEGRKA